MRLLTRHSLGKDESSAASDVSKKTDTNGTKTTGTSTTAPSTNGTNGDAIKEPSPFKKNSDFKQDSRKDDKKKEGTSLFTL